MDDCGSDLGILLHGNDRLYVRSEQMIETILVCFLLGGILFLIGLFLFLVFIAEY